MGSSLSDSLGSLLARVDARLERASASLSRRSRPGFVALAVASSLGMALLFFSPRLCVLIVPSLGTYEWERAQTYLAQCAHPFATAAEPAMQWRLLPPLVAHMLRLPGDWPLALPWAGLILFLGALTSSLERITGSRLAAWLSVALFCTSGPVLFITMCNGINDGWWMFGLLSVFSSRRIWAVAAACLFMPWVDERFLLGLPLALCCRHIVLGSVFPTGRRSLFWIGAASLPYPAVRIFSLMAHSDIVSANFLQGALAHLPHYLPNACFGWWNGYRAGWVLIGVFFWYVRRAYRGGPFGLTLAATLTAWACVTVLAADLTRSTNLLFPLFAAGTWAVAGSFGALAASRFLLLLLAANLVMPFEMVTYDKSLLLHSLPFELIRLFKNWR